MTLAALVVVCLAVTVIATLAVRAHRLPAPLGVVAAAVVPLGAWLFMQLASEPARSPVRFEVLGQYHRLSDTIRIATSADADVVLTAPGAADADVALSFDAATAQLRVAVTRARVPILLDDSPINALPLARHTTIRTGSGDSVTVSRPFLCVRCNTRYVRNGETRSEIRLDRTPVIAIGTDTVRLFRVGGTAYVAADPGAGITIDGTPIPAALTGAADSLFVGWPDGARMGIAPLPARHRMDIRLGSADRARWVLPRTVDDTLTLLVSASAAAPLPGTMPVLNPGAAARSRSRATTATRSSRNSPSTAGR
jgi:hypothetical protein